VLPIHKRRIESAISVYARDAHRFQPFIDLKTLQPRAPDPANEQLVQG
jgi:hypothetical protein